jgi:hypothetical protein
MPMLRAADLHELRLAFETSNMTISAEMKLRRQSCAKRAAAVTSDWIIRIWKKNWNVWINIYKGRDGSMQFEKQVFGSWSS